MDSKKSELEANMSIKITMVVLVILLSGMVAVGMTFSFAIITTKSANAQSGASPSTHAPATNTSRTTTTQSTKALVSCSNLPFLWKHIHDPKISGGSKDRLPIQQYCTSVTGTILSQTVENDGDAHIRLILDPQYSQLSRPANYKNELVVEVICWDPTKITYSAAQQACQGIKPHFIDIPQPGTHVFVSGSYVYDSQHGNWGEIHPVDSLYKK